jgi:hypothetical protein
MFNNPYLQQQNMDRINDQIKQLENIRNQMQQPMQPTNLTQNFQLAPNKEMMRFANSLEDVQKEAVYVNTPFFSKDMSILWVKNISGDTKTYELKEIIKKDEKDLQIEFLQAQIEDLKKGMKENAKSNDDNVNESVESKESTDV